MRLDEKYLFKRFLVFLAISLFWYVIFFYRFIQTDPFKGMRELIAEERAGGYGDQSRSDYEIKLTHVALAPPSRSHTRPSILAVYSVKHEEKKIRDFIHKNDPDAEIFIHPEPQEKLLEKYGWEKLPFTWRGNKIFIKREPKKNQVNRILVSA